MGDWNLPCTECPRPTWTWVYSSKISSQKVFIHVSLVATGWYQWRRQARTAAASLFSTGGMEHFFVEALHTYGANVVVFQLVLGDRRWFIVGC